MPDDFALLVFFRGIAGFARFGIIPADFIRAENDLSESIAAAAPRAVKARELILRSS